VHRSVPPTSEERRRNVGGTSEERRRNVGGTIRRRVDRGSHTRRSQFIFAIDPVIVMGRLPVTTRGIFRWTLDDSRREKGARS